MKHGNFLHWAQLCLLRKHVAGTLGREISVLTEAPERRHSGRCCTAQTIITSLIDILLRPYKTFIYGVRLSPKYASLLFVFQRRQRHSGELRHGP